MQTHAFAGLDDLLHAVTSGTDLLAVGVVRDGFLEMATPTLRRQLRAPESAQRLRLCDIVAPYDYAHVEDVFACAGATPRHVIFRARRFDDTEFDVEVTCQRVAPASRDGGVAVVWTDVSARRQSESALRHAVFCDPLTGLPNRAMVAERLREALLDARTSDVGFAVLAANLDDLRAVNERGGREAGDHVLRVVAERLRGSVRESDTIARVSGDQFTFVLPAAAQPASAAIVAGRAIRAVADPILLGGADAVEVGLTVGVALWPHHGADAEALVSSAEAALRAAKRAGKGRYRLAGHERDAAAHLPSIWRDSLSIGVPSLDAQHRELASLVDRVADALYDHGGGAALLGALEALLDHTRAHFREEERLMAAVSYAGRESHAREHHRLLDDLRNLSVGVDEPGVALAVRYLQDWLERHIDTMDRAVAHALRSAGAVRDTRGDLDSVIEG